MDCLGELPPAVAEKAAGRKHSCLDMLRPVKIWGLLPFLELFPAQFVILLISAFVQLRSKALVHALRGLVELRGRLVPK